MTKTADQIEQHEAQKAQPTRRKGTVTERDRKAASKILGVEGRRVLSRKERRALKGKRADGKPLSEYAHGQNPGSHTAAGNRYKKTPLAPWQPERTGPWAPGVSGNPNGRAQSDTARKIARAIFEQNQEALYEAYGRAALQGNAYAFSVLADRAYGKLKERHEVEVTAHADLQTTDLVERIAQLERELGYAGEMGKTGTPSLPAPGIITAYRSTSN